MLTPELIEEWYKTASYVLVVPIDGNQIVLDRVAFEAYVERNKKREWTNEDDNKIHTMHWHEYWEADCVVWDLIAFIEVTKACDKAKDLITDLLKP